MSGPDTMRLLVFEAELWRDPRVRVIADRVLQIEDISSLVAASARAGHLPPSLHQLVAKARKQCDAGAEIARIEPLGDDALHAAVFLGLHLVLDRREGVAE